MSKYRYKLVDIDVHENIDKEILNDHLRDGWELHSVYTASPGLFLLQAENPRFTELCAEVSELAHELTKETK